MAGVVSGKRKRLANRTALALSVASCVLVLAGCGAGVDPDRETQSERIDRLYSECVAAGGSFEYNGSLPYWQCRMPDHLDGGAS